MSRVGWLVSVNDRPGDFAAKVAYLVGLVAWNPSDENPVKSVNGDSIAIVRIFGLLDEREALAALQLGRSILGIDHAGNEELGDES